MHGKLEFANFQLCASMEPFAEAEWLYMFPLGA
jgi:hypothetical protein